MDTAPCYLKLGIAELRRRSQKAETMMQRCCLCARVCGVNRLKGENGPCRTGQRAVVCSYHSHFGEEAPLVGYGGSGTIFFTHCNLACLFCQNYEISHLGEGFEVDHSHLAAMMLRLQDMGCHNINLVSPSHVVPQLLAALVMAVEGDLRLPIVYNTGGYDSMPALRLLDGIVDIYMPDAKYDDAAVAERYSGIKSYPKVNRVALKEMHRQVGDLVLDKRGVTQRGLLVRHLVLPNGLAGTEGVVKFIAEEISRDTYINIMSQYRPCYRASEHPPLNRPTTRQEYQEAVKLALKYGLTRLDKMWW